MGSLRAVVSMGSGQPQDPSSVFAECLLHNRPCWGKVAPGVMWQKEQHKHKGQPGQPKEQRVCVRLCKHVQNTSANCTDFADLPSILQPQGGPRSARQRNLRASGSTFSPHTADCAVWLQQKLAEMSNRINESSN